MTKRISTKQRNDLTDLATDIALRMLSAKNTPSDNHKLLIRATCETLVRAASGHLDWRVAIALPTGAGKSTALASTLFAIHEMDLIQTMPVMVLQEQILAGQDLHRLLLAGYGDRTGIESDKDTGIKARLIAHVHQDEGKSPEDAEYAPIVIATHARSRMAHDVKRMTLYGGRRRGIWIDEGLLATDAFGRTVTKVKTVIGEVAAEARQHARELKAATNEDRSEEANRVTALYVWAVDVVAKIKRADEMLCLQIKTQSTGPKTLDVKLPKPEFDADWAIGFCKRMQINNLAEKLILATAFDSSAFTLVARGVAGSVLNHRRVLPVEFDSGAVVLDACYDIDALQKLDDGLIRAEGMSWWPRTSLGPLRVSEMKTWQNVTLLWMKANSGNHSLRKSGAMKALIISVAKLLIKIGRDGDRILVCAYQAFEGSLARRIEQAIETLDPSIHVVTSGASAAQIVEGKKTFYLSTVHWGAHHSTNEHQDARIVIALGDFTIANEDAAAMIMGQRAATDDVPPKPTPSSTTEFEESDLDNLAEAAKPMSSPIPTRVEILAMLDQYAATKLGQLAGRGRARQVENGAAKEMVFAMVTARERTFLALQKDLMPGSKWTRWDPPEVLIASEVKQAAGGDKGRDARTEKSNVKRAYDIIRPQLEAMRKGSRDPIRVSSRRTRVLFGLPGPETWLSTKVLSRAFDRLVLLPWISLETGPDGKPTLPRTIVVEPSDAF